MIQMTMLTFARMTAVLFQPHFHRRYFRILWLAMLCLASVIVAGSLSRLKVLHDLEVSSNSIDKTLDLGHTRGQREKQINWKDRETPRAWPKDARFWTSQRLNSYPIAMGRKIGKAMWACRTPDHCNAKPRQRYRHHSIALCHSCQHPLLIPFPHRKLVRCIELKVKPKQPRIANGSELVEIPLLHIKLPMPYHRLFSMSNFIKPTVPLNWLSAAENTKKGWSTTRAKERNVWPADLGFLQFISHLTLDKVIHCRWP